MSGCLPVTLRHRECLRAVGFHQASSHLPLCAAGSLAPALKLDPPGLTTKLGQVAKIAVSLAGKTMTESYTGLITLNFTSGELQRCRPVLASSRLFAFLGKRVGSAG